MSKITAVILAKNEEKMIADCIDSVNFVNEILVIDSNSKDRTAEIAKHMGAKVYKHDFSDFSNARNFGLSKVKTSWAFYIDSDERVSEELKKSIQKTISSETQKNAFKILRKNYYFGNHQWPHIEQLERLFKTKELQEWKGTLHESPLVNGEVGVLDGYLLHYTHRDLTSMVEKTIIWSEKEARLRFEAKHPKMAWWRFPRVMGTAFFDSYIKQKGYKAKTAGLVEATYQMYSMFITYARLWEMQNEYDKEKSSKK